MGTTDVDIYRGSSLDSRIRYANVIADARGLLPAGVVNAPQALLIFEQASALGIPPITGLSNIHIIKGRPTLSAGLMSGLIRQAGHKLRVWVEGNGEEMKAIAELIRSDDPDFTFHAEFSIADARRADLYPGKSDSNWAKYPRAMLKSRVTSEVAREGATDVFIGSAYTPEEMNPDLPVDDHGELIAQPAPEPQRSNLTPETTDSSEIKHQPDGMPVEVRAQWFETATKLTGNRKGLDAMYQDIKTKGLFNVLDPEDNETKLVDYVVALGKAAKEAEEKRAATGQPEPEYDTQTGEQIYDAEVVPDDEESDGPPAVLDPEVDAVSPSQPAEKAPTRSRARKPANASDAPA